MDQPIPFNRPYLGAAEKRAVIEALRGDTLHGDGPIGRRVQRQLCEWLGVRYVFLTTSCTHALEMAMITLGIGAGDEVVMPAFTFVSTANAVVLRGAQPIFAEIQPDTLNVDPKDVQRKITPRTKAIIPIHYAGVACDIDAILDIARNHGLSVVEDAAQGVDAYYKGRPLGTLGDVGCYSFHDTKNLTSGEGGAFITNDEEIAHRAEFVREKGTNRSAFLRGEVDKYTWISEGSSYIQSDILVAILEAQLAKRDEIKAKRKLVWDTYHEQLIPLAESGRVVLPVIPPNCDSNYHCFFVRVSSRDLRDDILVELNANGIGATFHYIPLHTSPFGLKVSKSITDLPVTQRCSETLIRLPLYPQLSQHIPHIAQKVREIIDKHTYVPATAYA